MVDARFELRMNRFMFPLHAALAGYSSEPLPDGLASNVASGLMLSDGCICIRDREAWLDRAPEPKSSYREWYANKLLLDSTLGPSDPAWRLQLLSWAMTAGHALLEQAIPLCGEQRMQVLISLQSAPGHEDPDLDFATGALFFFSVRDEIDDYSLPARMDPSPGVKALAQPVMTLSYGNDLHVL